MSLINWWISNKISWILLVTEFCLFVKFSGTYFILNWFKLFSFFYNTKKSTRKVLIISQNFSFWFFFSLFMQTLSYALFNTKTQLIIHSLLKFFFTWIQCWYFSSMLIIAMSNKNIISWLNDKKTFINWYNIDS
jgi:hypothetical protein